MELKEVSRVIKPKFYKKYTMGLSFILVLNMIQVFAPVILKNDFDPVIVAAQLITISLMGLIFTNYFYKIIKVDDDYISYKGLTFTNTMKYQEINRIHFDSKLEGKRPVYNIIFEGSTTLKIKDAQNFKNEDLMSLLDHIQKQTNISTNDIKSIAERL